MTATQFPVCGEVYFWDVWVSGPPRLSVARLVLKSHAGSGRSNDHTGHQQAAPLSTKVQAAIPMSGWPE